MAEGIKRKRRLSLANDDKTPFEIYSIILRGVMSTLKSIFVSYYVSENIEGMMKYVNEKKIISADEYRQLLADAKDFYPVVICALLIKPIKRYSNNFHCKELTQKKKEQLFMMLNRELSEFFIDWLCNIEIDPLLFYRLAQAYHKTFNINLHIHAQMTYGLTAIEERITKIQISEIVSIFLIEQVAVQLGLAGLDYLDYYKPEFKLVEEEIDTPFLQTDIMEKCIDTIT